MENSTNSVAMLINEIARELEPQVIAWRRQIHARPETGWCEYITTYLIVKVLSDIGWDVQYGRNIINLKTRYGLPDP